MGWFAYDGGSNVIAVPGKNAASSEKRLLRWNKQCGKTSNIKQPLLYNGKSFSTFTEIWSKHPLVTMISWDV